MSSGTSSSITAGRVLIKDNTALPQSLSLQGVPHSLRWRMLTGLDGYALGRALMKVNWTLFYVVDETKSIAFGINRERSIGAAVNRILTKLYRLKFNAVEIAEVTSKQFLGLRITRVSARSRHIQQGSYMVHQLTP